jgi:four helix bundle protein
MTKITGYKDLQVWQRSMSLVETIYRITAKFPHTEQWELLSQMRRAAISVPSNIAEGYGRNATGEYRHHLSIARGSLLELDTQVLLCKRLNLLQTTRSTLFSKRSMRSVRCSLLSFRRFLNSCLLPVAALASASD